MLGVGCAEHHLPLLREADAARRPDVEHGRVGTARRHALVHGARRARAGASCSSAPTFAAAETPAH
jgi:hypothetical protein